MRRRLWLRAMPISSKLPPLRDSYSAKIHNDTWSILIEPHSRFYFATFPITSNESIYILIIKSCSLHPLHFTQSTAKPAAKSLAIPPSPPFLAERKLNLHRTFSNSAKKDDRPSVKTVIPTAKPLDISSIFTKRSLRLRHIPWQS